MIRCKLNQGRNESTGTWIALGLQFTGGSPENEKFWEATPGGNLKVTSVLSDVFLVGQEYYLDISEAG